MDITIVTRYHNGLGKVMGTSYPKVVYTDDVTYDEAVSTCTGLDKQRINHIVCKSNLTVPLDILYDVATTNPFKSSYLVWIGDGDIPDEWIGSSPFTSTRFLKGSIRCVSTVKYVQMLYNKTVEGIVYDTIIGGDIATITKAHTLCNDTTLTSTYKEYPYLFDIIRIGSNGKIPTSSEMYESFAKIKVYTVGFCLPGGLDYRGTAVAVYDYAIYNERICGNKSIVLTRPYELVRDSVNTSVKGIYDKFLSLHTLYYSDFDNMLNHMVVDNDIDIIYTIGAGWEPNMFTNRLPCKTVYHCVFIPNNYVVGCDVYLTISDYVSTLGTVKYPPLPHMVGSLVPYKGITTNLRQHLGIPSNATVYGRYGGLDAFDIPFVWHAIESILKSNENVYFIFASTPTYIIHPRIIYTAPIHGEQLKTAFILTCDAMIHARSRGETFGLACSEFATLGKPIITYSKSREDQHVRTLGTNGLYYHNMDTLMAIFTTFDRSKDYTYMEKVYDAYTPTKVMSLWSMYLFH